MKGLFAALMLSIVVLLGMFVWLNSGYTIYRRVDDRKIVDVFDGYGRRVTLKPEELQKLVGEVVWVSPDYQPVDRLYEK